MKISYNQLMNQKSIYLDYAATTPVDEAVSKKMNQCLTRDGIFGNPASRSHSFGWKAEELVEEAREQVAGMLSATSREIIFTSGATESNNLAIKGASQFYQRKGKHFITMSTEHKAVLDTMRELERSGCEVTYLDPQSDGLLNLDDLKSAIREDTVLVSIMHANNETGVVQDISSIGKLCRESEVYFHVDAAQSAGKIPINVKESCVDLLSISAHKIYGPKGIGALYVSKKPKVRITAQMHGGGHEFGMRSGTLATHQIVGLGTACAVATECMDKDTPRILKLRDTLQQELLVLPSTYVNGSLEHRLPGHLNISFAFIEGESLIMALSEIAVSSGSACTSASLEPSYVLRALGLNDELAHSSLRMVVGRFTTEKEIRYTINKIKASVSKLRDLSPLWEMHNEGIDVANYKWDVS